MTFKRTACPVLIVITIVIVFSRAPTYDEDDEDDGNRECSLSALLRSQIDPFPKAPLCRCLCICICFCNLNLFLIPAAVSASKLSDQD